jgi:hypothetical protein
MPQVNYPLRFLSVLLLIPFLAAACQINTAAQPATPDIPTQTENSPTNTVTRTATEFTNPIPTATEDTPNPVLLQPSATPKPSATPSRRLVLMAVGDIMLGRTIGDLIETQGSEAPFFDTAETLRSADITVGNLECPISERGEMEEKTYAFRAPVAAGQSLAFAGFNLVNLANNHTLDYGPLALQDTIEILAANDIQTVGAGMNEAEAYAPTFIEVNGLRVAFLGFVDVHPTDYDYRTWEAGPDKPGVAWAHEDRVRAGVITAKAQADIVIVLVHNGYEFVQQVSSQQQKIAHLAIDSGASLVIGSHPHVLQRIESYHNGLIAYSMGNFVFDNFLFPPNYTAILVVELSPQGVDSYELIDVIVQLNGVPHIMPYNLED